MRIPYRLVSLVLGAALTGCGGSLMFPDDGSPAALQAVLGNGQEGIVGRRLQDSLVVKLTDASSRPIAGVPVAFQFKIDVPGAEVDPAETATDSNGLASTEVRLGVRTGAHQIEARVTSPAELIATFVVTAVGWRRDDDDDDDD